MNSLGISVLAMIAFVMSVHCGGNRRYEKEWIEWMQKYDVTYQNDKQEEEQRYNIWEKNMDFINTHNEEFKKGKHSYELGMNHLGDRHQEELQLMVTGFNMADVNKTYPRCTIISKDVANTAVPPDSIDWRDHNCVTPVINQKRCASCWAVSAVGSLECQLKKRTNKLRALSVQQLVDCASQHGCRPFFVHEAFNYVKKKGITLDENYPYVGKKQHCLYNWRMVAWAGQCHQIPEGCEEKLEEVVGTIGPVSVAIKANVTSFQFYKKGVYEDPACDGKPLNHAVLVIGYGMEKVGNRSVAYWLVKNSYGEQYGDKGYIKMAKGKCNFCGIASQATYAPIRRWN
ncbi:cathepsin K-like [Hyperolius riggenbachi]|uniref:cathepsin K-like n=1 Tax=Hyperolius riggenbachi TaxID=752182 RepID=UPI0035A371E2